MEEIEVDVSIGSQELTTSNCIYIISEELNLKGGTFEISGENCTLLFKNKGKIKYGTIKLNKTYIDAPLSGIFEYVVFDEKNTTGIINDIIRVEWFKKSTDTDDSYAFQKCIDAASIGGNKIQLLSKVYYLSQTLQLYSGTIIEGTIMGAMDRNKIQGTRLEFNLYGAKAMSFDTKSGDNYKTTCYKFRLSNLFIINTYQSDSDNSLFGYEYPNTIGISFTSDDTATAPRNGTLENIMFYGFYTAIQINALSYVKFENISISCCKNGIVIDNNNSGKYIEFGWFNRIVINNLNIPVGSSIANDVIGIEINSGNNLYFNEIDINDCNIGLYFNSLASLHTIFVNRMNVIRCNTCTYFHMEKSHITRVKISEVTMKYGACTRNGGTSTKEFYYGFKFDRTSPYTISTCSFVDIADTECYSNSSYKAIEINEISLDTCVLDRMRILNPMTKVNAVRKLGILNFQPSGEITIPAQSNTGTVNLCNYNIFNDSLPTPTIIPVGESPYPTSQAYSFDTTLKFTISLSAVTTTTAKYKYIFPTMI